MKAANLVKEAFNAIVRNKMRSFLTMLGIIIGVGSVVALASLGTMATSARDTLTVLLAAVASVSLLVGGIGIMNIMLVSVTERTREIGIRMAIGARSGDILLQFLLEATVLSVLGGALGLIGGLGLAYALGSVLDTSVLPNTFLIAAAVLFSSFVGIFFGFYPARKAAGMNPVEALRYD